MTIDDQIRILERFNEKVDRLNQREFVEEAKGGGSLLQWQKGLGWDGIHIGPSEKTVDATILTLRFFILDNESTSLNKMAKLYLDLHDEPRLSTQFCEIRDRVNSYLDTPSSLSISEAGAMTHREIFDTFINGDLAHSNDAMKEAKYRSISQTALFPLFQHDFASTVQLLLSALNKMQEINYVALNLLRSGETP